MTLKQGNSNTSYQVVSIQLEEKLERRLEALGLTEGSTITIMNNQKKGSLTVKFRGIQTAERQRFLMRTQVRI